MTDRSVIRLSCRVIIATLLAVVPFCRSECEAAGAPTYDLIIRHGRIIDGTGAPWFRGDVAITGDKIAALGVLDPCATAPVVIDAKERYVAPGFIDVHTHCEDDLLSMPQAENFIRMGVTTVVTGNCGGSYLRLDEAFTSMTSKGIGVNVASFVGHNTIRNAVMRNVARDPSTTEIAEMKRLVRDAMKAGALGLSTGLIYTPGICSKTPEIAELAKEAARLGGIYATHMRSEGIDVINALDEALTVGLAARIPVQVSHHKIVAPFRFGQTTITLAMMDSAREQGIDVACDQYVYTASSTSISTMLPDWAVEGSRAEVRARLQDPPTREKVIAGIIEERRDKSGRKDLGYAVVANCRADPSLNGKNILQIARERYGDDSWHTQAQVVVDIVTSGGASMVFHSMDEDDVQRVACYPNTAFASDSGIRAFGVGVPHPRGYGNNARVLAHYVRELRLFPLEEAIRRMTSLPAQRMRFFDRGVLRPSMAADVVVFDLNRVQEKTTFAQPHAYAEGFDYVIVNGTCVIANGQLTYALPGKVLFGPGKTYDPDKICDGVEP
ncbi:MAG: D-aminoacylase [Candidatus Sumerlaeaceae bacterium]|nr:D-aminoacylase [Candidatus Sumerlaeaceae bacterium]